jgi:deoxycytidine triphosphate deaminase
MILSDADILQFIQSGNIRIDPFDPSALKGASYTLTLGARLKYPVPVV